MSEQTEQLRDKAIQLCAERGIAVHPYGHVWWLIGNGINRVVADEDLVERIELYNISGAKVLEVVGVNQIDMSALPKGLYVVVATIEGEVLVKKVVKK